MAKPRRRTALLGCEEADPDDNEKPSYQRATQSVVLRRMIRMDDLCVGTSRKSKHASGHEAMLDNLKAIVDCGVECPGTTRSAAKKRYLQSLKPANIARAAEQGNNSEQQFINDDVGQFKTARQLEGKKVQLRRHAWFRSVPLFKECSSVFIDLLCEQTETLLFEAGVNIFCQGDYGDAMYILNKGELEVEVNGNVVCTLENSSLFGEMACLIKDEATAKRSATIRTKTLCDVRKISREWLYFCLKRCTADAKLMEKESAVRYADLKARKIVEQNSPKRGLSLWSTVRTGLMDLHRVDRSMTAERREGAEPGDPTDSGAGRNGSPFSRAVKALQLKSLTTPSGAEKPNCLGTMTNARKDDSFVDGIIPTASGQASKARDDCKPDFSREESAKMVPSGFVLDGHTISSDRSPCRTAEELESSRLSMDSSISSSLCKGVREDASDDNTMTRLMTPCCEATDEKADIINTTLVPVPVKLLMDALNNSKSQNDGDVTKLSGSLSPSSLDLGAAARQFALVQAALETVRPPRSAGRPRSSKSRPLEVATARAHLGALRLACGDKDRLAGLGQRRKVGHLISSRQYSKRSPATESFL